MISLSALWLPILLSAVIVFVAVLMTETSFEPSFAT